jgi:hypothetical protein
LNLTEDSGGSVLAHFISRVGQLNEGPRLYATVRTDEQVQSLAKLRATVVKIDLTNEEAVEEVVLSNASKQYRNGYC